MNEAVFDALTGALAASRSRRGLTRRLGSLVLGGLMSLAPAGSEARRKRRKKRRKGKATCPRGKKRCEGVCRQCCTVEDCRALPTGDGLACEGGQCVCTIAGTRRCPADTKWSGDCGRCCNDSECPGLAACVIRFVGPPECFCGTGLTCEQVCIPQDCDGWCTQTCNIPGKPAAGSGCCSGNALTCQHAPEQGDPNKHRCLPI